MSSRDSSSTPVRGRSNVAGGGPATGTVVPGVEPGSGDVPGSAGTGAAGVGAADGAGDGLVGLSGSGGVLAAGVGLSCAAGGC